MEEFVLQQGADACSAPTTGASLPSSPSFTLPGTNSECAPPLHRTFGSSSTEAAADSPSSTTTTGTSPSPAVTAADIGSSSVSLVPSHLNSSPFVLAPNSHVSIGGVCVTGGLCESVSSGAVDVSRQEIKHTSGEAGGELKCPWGGAVGAYVAATAAALAEANNTANVVVEGKTRNEGPGVPVASLSTRNWRSSLVASAFSSADCVVAAPVVAEAGATQMASSAAKNILLAGDSSVVLPAAVKALHEDSISASDLLCGGRGVEKQGEAEAATERKEEADLTAVCRVTLLEEREKQQEISAALLERQQTESQITQSQLLLSGLSRENAQEETALLSEQRACGAAAAEGTQERTVAAAAAPGDSEAATHQRFFVSFSSSNKVFSARQEQQQAVAAGESSELPYVKRASSLLLAEQKGSKTESPSIICSSSSNATEIAIENEKEPTLQKGGIVCVGETEEKGGKEASTAATADQVSPTTEGASPPSLATSPALTSTAPAAPIAIGTETFRNSNSNNSKKDYSIYNRTTCQVTPPVCYQQGDKYGSTITEDTATSLNASVPVAEAAPAASHSGNIDGDLNDSAQNTAFSFVEGKDRHQQQQNICSLRSLCHHHVQESSSNIDFGGRSSVNAVATAPSTRTPTRTSAAPMRMPFVNIMDVHEEIHGGESDRGSDYCLEMQQHPQQPERVIGELSLSVSDSVGVGPSSPHVGAPSLLTSRGASYGGAGAISEEKVSGTIEGSTLEQSPKHSEVVGGSESEKSSNESIGIRQQSLFGGLGFNSCSTFASMENLLKTSLPESQERNSVRAATEDDEEQHQTDGASAPAAAAAGSGGNVIGGGNSTSATAAAPGTLHRGGAASSSSSTRVRGRSQQQQEHQHQQRLPPEAEQEEEEVQQPQGEQQQQQHHRRQRYEVYGGGGGTEQREGDYLPYSRSSSYTQRSGSHQQEQQRMGSGGDMQDTRYLQQQQHLQQRGGAGGGYDGSSNWRPLSGPGGRGGGEVTSTSASPCTGSGGTADDLLLVRSPLSSHEGDQQQQHTPQQPHIYSSSRAPPHASSTSPAANVYAQQDLESDNNYGNRATTASSSSAGVGTGGTWSQQQSTRGGSGPFVEIHHTEAGGGAGGTLQHRQQQGPLHPSSYAGAAVSPLSSEHQQPRATAPPSAAGGAAALAMYEGGGRYITGETPLHHGGTGAAAGASTRGSGSRSRSYSIQQHQQQQQQSSSASMGSAAAAPTIGGQHLPSSVPAGQRWTASGPATSRRPPLLMDGSNIHLGNSYDAASSVPPEDSSFVSGGEDKFFPTANVPRKDDLSRPVGLWRGYERGGEGLPQSPQHGGGATSDILLQLQLEATSGDAAAGGGIGPHQQQQQRGSSAGGGGGGGVVGAAGGRNLSRSCEEGLSLSMPTSEKCMMFTSPQPTHGGGVSSSQYLQMLWQNSEDSSSTTSMWGETSSNRRENSYTLLGVSSGGGDPAGPCLPGTDMSSSRRAKFIQQQQHHHQLVYGGADVSPSHERPGAVLIDNLGGPYGSPTSSIYSGSTSAPQHHQQQQPSSRGLLSNSASSLIDSATAAAGASTDSPPGAAAPVLGPPEYAYGGRSTSRFERTMTGSGGIGGAAGYNNMLGDAAAAGVHPRGPISPAAFSQHHPQQVPHSSSHHHHADISTTGRGDVGAAGTGYHTQQWRASGAGANAGHQQHHQSGTVHQEQRGNGTSSTLGGGYAAAAAMRMGGEGVPYMTSPRGAGTWSEDIRGNSGGDPSRHQRQQQHALLTACTSEGGGAAAAAEHPHLYYPGAGGLCAPGGREAQLATIVGETGVKVTGEGERNRRIGGGDYHLSGAVTAVGVGSLMEDNSGNHSSYVSRTGAAAVVGGRGPAGPGQQQQNVCRRRMMVPGIIDDEALSLQQQRLGAAGGSCRGFVGPGGEGGAQAATAVADEIGNAALGSGAGASDGGGTRGLTLSETSGTQAALRSSGGGGPLEAAGGMGISRQHYPHSRLRRIGPTGGTLLIDDDDDQETEEILQEEKQRETAAAVGGGDIIDGQEGSSRRHLHPHEELIHGSGLITRSREAETRGRNSRSGSSSSSDKEEYSDRCITELTKGNRCIRGAPRATVQQLYGQTYDLEALALEIDRTSLDAMDTGEIKRDYYPGVKFPVGDLGRKLLLIAVREKMEAGTCGQLKFLTLADLFRLAYELGMWSFALKVSMAYKAGGLRIPKGSLGQHAADSVGGGGPYSSSQGGSAVALRDDESGWFPSNSSSPSGGSSSSSSGVLDALVSGSGGSAGSMASMRGEAAQGGIGDGRDGVSAVGGAGRGEGDPSSGGGIALSSSSGGTGRRAGGKRKGRRGGGGGAASRTRSAAAAAVGGGGTGTRGASSSTASGSGAGAPVSEEDENDLGRFELRHRGVGSSRSRTGTRGSREEGRKSISEQQQQPPHQQQGQHEEVDEDLSFPHFSPPTPGVREEVRKQREATAGESDGTGATAEDGGGSVDHRGPRTLTTMTQQQQQHSHLTGSTMGPLLVGARFGEEEVQRQHHLPPVPLASSHQQHPTLRMNALQEQQPHVGHVYDPQEKQLYMTHGGSTGGGGGNALVMNSSEDDIVMLQQQELMQSHGSVRSATAVGSRGYYGGGVLGAGPPPPLPHQQQHARPSGIASSTGQQRRDVEYMQQQHHADMRSSPRGGGAMHSHPEANEELMLKQPRVGQPVPSHNMQETAAACNREAYVGASIYEGLSAGSTTEIGIRRERSTGEIRDYRMEIRPSLETRVGNSSNTERGLEKTSGAATHGGVDWRERRGMQGTDASGGSSGSSSGGIAAGSGDTQQQRGSLGVVVRAGGDDGDLLGREISGVVDSRERQQPTDDGVHEYAPVQESGEIASGNREIATVTEQQLQQVMFNRSRGGTAGERKESHGGDEPHFWEARGVVTSCENSVGRKQHEDQKEEQEEQQQDVELYKNTEVGKENVSEERRFSQTARSSSSASAARSKAMMSSRSGSAGTIGNTAAASIGKEDANASLHVTGIAREGGRDLGVPASEEYSTSGSQGLTPPPPPGKRMRTMSEETGTGGGGGEVREKGFGVGASEGCEEMGGGGGMRSGPPGTPPTTTITMSRGPARQDTSSSLFSSGAAGLLLLDSESSGAAGAVEEEEEHLLLGPRARLSASGAAPDGRDGGDGMTLWATGSRDLHVEDDHRPSSGEGELLRCTSNSALISSHAESGSGSSVLMRGDSRSSDFLVRPGSGSGEGLLRGTTHRTSTSSRPISTAPLLQQRGSSSDSLVAGDMQDHTSRGASTILYRGGGGGLLTDEGNEEDNSGLGGATVGGGAGHHEGRHGRGMFWHDDEEREERRSDDEALISQQQHHRDGGVAGERGRVGEGVSGPGSGGESSHMKSVDQRDDDDVDGPGLQFSSMFSSLLEREDPDWRSWRSDPLARKRPQSPPYTHHHL